MERYRNRVEAGQVLSQALSPYKDRANVLVLALPRGGVPVAYEVAKALHAVLDIFLVRKLGVPGHEELAMGAIASGGTLFIDDETVRALSISQTSIERSIEREEKELQRREVYYRKGNPAVTIEGKTVLIVDDGLATGSSMRVAVEAVRKHQPLAIVVAVPVAAPSTCQEFKALADDVICVRTPKPFQAVGNWYEDFSQVTDEEVRQILARGLQDK